ncbi:MAG: DUF3800 domain-containing protein [Cognatishimia sp.]
MALIIPTEISCDESGFTGNRMLDPSQTHFTYASHDLSQAEADNLVSTARRKFKVQMPELKASKLLKSANGRELLAYVLEQMEGRYIATIYEKRLSLACKLFEYIYEPVLQRNNALFYKNNTHRFVAMYIYMQMLQTPVQTLVQEFEAFMRSLDPEDAPGLLHYSPGTEPDPLIGQVLRFARGYNIVIARETAHLRDTDDQGKWVLDLSASAVFSHLAEWGERHALLEVTCDDSKPLRAISGFMDVMINRPEQRVFEGFGKRRPLTWTMSGSINFASSDTHNGVQLADLVAGVTRVIPLVGENLELSRLAELVFPHLHEDCIMPDFEHIDLGRDEVAVNWLVLEELASRADRGDDALEGMEAIFHFAHQTLPAFRASSGL